jgi:hypothetical protein
VTGVSGAHHVLGIECLLSQLGDGKNTESLGANGSERCESDQEEMQTGEWNHVNGKLSKITVKLTRETKRAGGTGDGISDQVVQVTVAGVGKLESAEADIIKSFVIKRKALVSILYKLMDGESGVVGLDNGVGHLGRRDDTVSADDTVGVLLLDLGNKESSHTRSGSTSHGVGKLKSLKDIATFTLLADTLHNRIYEFSTLGVVTLGPVVTSSTLAKDEIIGTEKTSEGSSANGIHGTGLKISEDGTGNVSMKEKSGCKLRTRISSIGRYISIVNSLRTFLLGPR